MLFEPIEINGTTFENRLFRSSLGGRNCFYDGTVTDAWKHLERRFAEGGVGGIVSTTFAVDDRRAAPFEYPRLTDDRFVKPIAEGVKGVQALGCRYILQIGDPGYHTQVSLFSEDADEKSSSGGFDLTFGYRNRRTAMTIGEVEHSVQQFAAAAARVREAGCDGLEITASKGYLVHQFLNPAINRRRDRYGGSPEGRFRFLEEIVVAVREAIGRDFPFGIRISSRDYNYLPLNVRLPLVFPLRDYWQGNGLGQTLGYARRLEQLGVDYLHVTSGFGFMNPKENAGGFPMEEFRLFYDLNRHLSRKAAARAALAHAVPLAVWRWTNGRSWRFEPAFNLDDARAFKQAVGIPVIANGGFQERSVIHDALDSGGCDVVSMARALLANPDLPRLFRDGAERPDNPCTYCNRCAARTAGFPLGCYEPARFSSIAEMEEQILSWSTPVPVEESGVAERRH